MVFRGGETTHVRQSSVAWAEMRIVTARIYSTYETTLGNEYFDKDEAGGLKLTREVGERDEGELFPAEAYEPIALRHL